MAHYKIKSQYEKFIITDTDDKQIKSIIECMNIDWNRPAQGYKLTTVQYNKFCLLFDNGFSGNTTYFYNEPEYTFSSDDLGLFDLTLKEALKACKKPYRCPKTIDMFEKENK
jgi:hypothetical protein